MSARPLSRLFKFLTFFFASGSLALSYGDAQKPDRLPDARSLSVTAHRLQVPKGNVDIPTSLSLRLTDAWDLNSANDEFGGLSALYASGSALTFVSDKGAIIRLGQDASSTQWTGVIGPLPFGCGDMRDKHNRDTESIAVDRHTGSMWIGFENRNGLCRIASPKNGGTRFAAPLAMKHWRLSGGPEASVRLKDGTMLVFQETAKGGSTVSDLLHFDRDPTDPKVRLTKMSYRPPTGYSAVDAAQLPDGRLLILNRRFALPFNFTTRISIARLPPLKEGAVMSGPIIARIDGEGIADNFEALAIDNDGHDLVIWLASDDNFLALQRSLLLRFVWPGAARLVASGTPR